MDSIERLNAFFEKFPGIGPRQAQRFVQFLLRSSPSMRRELADAIRDLGAHVHQCPQCMRYSAGTKGACTICSDDEREAQIAVVASDADLAALERSHLYRGKYFVLGGTISLASDKATGLRLRELKTLISDTKRPLNEIILAFPANPEGDATANRVRDEMEALAQERGVRISTLGRGLSTGSELEYADPDTLRSALANRK